MKKLFKNRAAGFICLILVAMLAVPALGGIRLSAKHRSLVRDFEKTVTETDRHGNDLYTDTDTVVVSAESMLVEGEKLAKGASAAIDERASRLRGAVDECKAARNAVARYIAYDAVVSTARQYYNALRDYSSDALSLYMSEITSQASRIERMYRAAYTGFLNEESELISRWPASLLARLFKIGGGR